MHVDNHTNLLTIRQLSYNIHMKSLIQVVPVSSSLDLFVVERFDGVSRLRVSCGVCSI